MSDTETTYHLLDSLCGNDTEQTAVVSVEPIIHLPHDDPFILQPAQLLEETLDLPLTCTESFSFDTLYETEEENKNNESDDTIILTENEISSMMVEGQKEPLRGRKRQRNTENWKRNVNKKRRQAGLSYKTNKGKTIRARELKCRKDCEGKCKFKCSVCITSEERQHIFSSFWSMSDTEKNHFYRKTLVRTNKERTRTDSKKSRRQYSIQYHFDVGEKRVRVCKEYYLSTLDISQRRIQWFFDMKNPFSPGSLDDKRGKQAKKCITQKEKDIIRNHINSFPRIPSHYCRASSSREYLESHLTVSKMYQLYTEKCRNSNINPQKLHVYREIFNTEFNLGFFIPKKDRCDICEEAKISKQINISDEDKHKYESHIISKELTKIERDKDRSGEDVVICFDMENVLVCPRANVSNFYYKRKLNVFNLTAHCSKNKKAYNCLWSESQAGRGGNEIANAMVKILTEVMTDIKNVHKLILWSDSCVPQNRNSIMTFALKSFMSKNMYLTCIEQKFCEPGHSCIQEVDNIHSHNEKYLSVSEIYSPVSLIRVLLQVRPRNSRVIQLRSFLNYQRVSNTLNFSVLPYSKVKYIKIEKDKPMFVQYKTSFSDEEHTKEVSIGKQVRGKVTSNFSLPTPVGFSHTPILSKEKIRDFRSMLKYIPLLDQQYFESIINTRSSNLKERKEKFGEPKQKRELVSRKKLKMAERKTHVKTKDKKQKTSQESMTIHQTREQTKNKQKKVKH